MYDVFHTLLVQMIISGYLACPYVLFVVDGGWGAWGPFTNCCNGTKSRARACDSPSPSHGGLTCSGNTEETQTCAPEACNGKIFNSLPASVVC